MGVRSVSDGCQIGVRSVSDACLIMSPSTSVLLGSPPMTLHRHVSSAALLLLSVQFCDSYHSCRHAWGLNLGCLRRYPCGASLEADSSDVLSLMLRPLLIGCHMRRRCVFSRVRVTFTLTRTLACIHLLSCVHVSGTGGVAIWCPIKSGFGSARERAIAIIIIIIISPPSPTSTPSPLPSPSLAPS